MVPLLQRVTFEDPEAGPGESNQSAFAPPLGTCGSEPAREGGLTADLSLRPYPDPRDGGGSVCGGVGCAGVIASKLAPTEFVAGLTDAAIFPTRF